MKHYIIKAINLPFVREWHIYENWVSTDKEKLIEKVRKDLEENLIFEPTELKLIDDDWLLINDDDKKWLKVIELDLVE